MIIFLYGTDTFRLARRAYGYRDIFQKKYDPAGISTVVLAGDEVAVADITAQLRAGGLFAKKRLVLVKNYLQQHVSKEWQAFAQAIPNLEKSSNVLVLIEEPPLDWRKQKSLVGSAVWKTLTQLPNAEEFVTLTGRALDVWLDKELARAGDRPIKINPEARLALLERTGSDLWFLHSALEQLMALRAGATIEAADVAALINAEVGDDVFALIDAVIAGNTRQALRLFNDQLTIGTPPLALVARLQRQLAYAIQAAAGASETALVKQFAIHSYVAGKAVRQARQAGAPAIERLFTALLDTEVALKSTGLPPGPLLARALFATKNPVR